MKVTKSSLHYLSSVTQKALFEKIESYLTEYLEFTNKMLNFKKY
jgi:hypothetical protein